MVWGRDPVTRRSTYTIQSVKNWNERYQILFPVLDSFSLLLIVLHVVARYQVSSVLFFNKIILYFAQHTVLSFFGVTSQSRFRHQLTT